MTLEPQKGRVTRWKTPGSLSHCLEGHPKRTIHTGLHISKNINFYYVDHWDFRLFVVATNPSDQYSGYKINSCYVKDIHRLYIKITWEILKNPDSQVSDQFNQSVCGMVPRHQSFFFLIFLGDSLYSQVWDPVCCTSAILKSMVCRFL